MNELRREAYLAGIMDGLESLEIPICDDNGSRIGSMRPLTKQHIQDHDIVEKLTDWRNRYKAFFLTQFEATPERTRHWLETIAFSETNRLLFLIYSEDLLVGHYGFRDLIGDSVLADNLLRGERDGHPMLMKYAVLALVEWLFDAMRVNEVYGYIFADNAMGLKLNRDVGFVCVDTLPLQKQVDGDDITWIIGKAGEQSPDNRYYQKVVIRRSTPSA
jgi:RimJ/RimL family protein N-acetyltransferase